MANKIRQMILAKKALKAQSADASPIIVPKSQQQKQHGVSFFQMTMGTFIFLMSIITVLACAHKFDGSFPEVAAAVPPPPAVATPSEKKIVVNTDTTRLDAVEAHIQKLEVGQRRIWHYSWLNMLATNENANMLKTCDGRDYVMFDKDGNLTRMPNSMKLSEEQIQKLELGVEGIK